MNTFGKYQVLDELGTGAAGVTYRARDTFRNRELALKVLHASATANAELRERLAAAAELRHSHIAGVCDLGEVDGSIYIATELLAGDGLDRHFRERQVLPLPQKLKLIAQVSEALTYAHSKGVAHGNLKPSNIFVVGKDAKILDFGLAGAFPNYLAPEQVLGQPFDARSDVFSCAVVLYELLVDAYPFQGPAGLIPRQIVHSDAAPLRSFDPRIPDELEQLLAHALKKNPQHRLETADQLASGLYTIARDFQNGRPSRPAPKPAQAAPAPPAAVPEPPIESELPTAFARPAPAPATEPAPTIILAAPAPSPSPSVSYVAVHPPVPVPVPVPVPIPTPREAPVTAAAVPATQKRKFRRARVIVYASAAVLTICIVVSLLSRQSIRGSQTNHAPAASPKISLPSGVRSEAVAPRPTASPDARDTSDPKPASDQASLDQVKSLWESGRYGQATELVNTILAANPANTEARAWRKKIRAAQQAEAGMK
jgi:serine/threonine protein kinase